MSESSKSRSSGDEAEKFIVCSLGAIFISLVSLLAVKAFDPRLLVHAHEPALACLGGCISIASYIVLRLIWRAGR